MVQCPMGFPGGASSKEPSCQCRRHKRHGFDPWVGKISWWRECLPSPVFLPGECHGQRSLVGYSPWGQKQLDTTEWLTFYRRERNLHVMNICPSPDCQNWLETPIMWYYASSFWEVTWEYACGNKDKEIHVYHVSHLQTKLYIEYRRIRCMCYI